MRPWLTTGGVVVPGATRTPSARSIGSGCGRIAGGRKMGVWKRCGDFRRSCVWTLERATVAILLVFNEVSPPRHHRRGAMNSNIYLYEKIVQEQQRDRARALR